MKKTINVIVLVTTLLTTQIQKARSAEIVGLTVGGVVATVAIMAAGYAVFGTGVFTLKLLDKNINLKTEDYRQALDVVASDDTKLINDGLRELLHQMRTISPELESVDDVTLLSKVVESVQEAGLN